MLKPVLLLLAATLVATLLSAAGAAPVPLTPAFAGDPVCVDTEEGQVCTEVDEQECTAPECASPTAHIWPDPIGSSVTCANNTVDSSSTTNCPQVNVIVATSGGGKVAVTYRPTTTEVPSLTDLSEHPKYGHLVSSACQTIGLAPDCQP